MSTYRNRLSRGRCCMAPVFGLLMVLSSVQAKDKKIKAARNEAKDTIEVAGPITLTNGPVKRLLPTQHYSSFYLYAEHDDGDRKSTRLNSSHP